MSEFPLLNRIEYSCAIFVQIIFIALGNCQDWKEPLCPVEVHVCLKRTDFRSVCTSLYFRW